MQMNISQQMKMQQKMILSPRMIQSMEILQLPIQALNERIEQELAENVVLEAFTQEHESAADSEVQHEVNKAREEATEPATEQKELVSENNNESDFERLLEMSRDMPDDWDDSYNKSSSSSNRVDDDMERSHDMMANMISRPQSLHDYLLEQFRFYTALPEIKEFGEFLIQNLDHNGRLQSSLPEIVQVYGKNISQEEALETLGLIQRLDPPGVGARDLKECLLLQIQPDTPYREILITLISSHLEDLSQNRLPAIERKTGYSIDQIKDALEELRHLEPHPGREFEAAPVEKVTPDLFVVKDSHGVYTVRLEDEYTPSLRISKRYQKLLQNGEADGDTKEYIKKKIESAKWLIESIEQRQNTLKRVAQAIIDHQTEFLDLGPDHIAPLKMQQIAEIVGVHVTTVSRAVDDKWIETPRGLFPLKRFFGGGTETEDGQEVAWDVVRNKLQHIIDTEDKSNPLSDDALVEELAKHGFKLARRTVTKYRKNMNIPSSRQRKEY